MQLETAGINTGKEVLAQPWNQDDDRCETRGEEGQQKSPPVMKAVLQQFAINFAYALKTSFELPLNSTEEIASRLTVFVDSLVLQ